MKLTQEQCETYWTQGVLIVKNALTHEDLQPVIDEISDWISERALALKEEDQIENLHEDEPFDKRFAKLLAQSGEMVGGLDIMHYRGKAIFEFLKNDNLLDVIEGIVGPEITCNPIQHFARETACCRWERELGGWCALAPGCRCHDAGSRRVHYCYMLASVRR